MPYKFVPDSFHTGVKAEALRAKIERKSTISHWLISIESIGYSTAKSKPTEHCVLPAHR